MTTEQKEEKIIEFLTVGNYFESNGECFYYLGRLHFMDSKETLCDFLYDEFAQCGCGRYEAEGCGDYGSALISGIYGHYDFQAKGITEKEEDEVLINELYKLLKIDFKAKSKKLKDFLQVGNHFKTNEEVLEHLDKFTYSEDDPRTLKQFFELFNAELEDDSQLVFESGDFAEQVVGGVVDNVYDDIIYKEIVEENRDVNDTYDHYEEVVTNRLIEILKL